MLRNKLNVVLLAAAAFIGVSGETPAQTKPLATSSNAGTDMLGLAIDMADRQRMLSQRMTKAYAQLVLDINPETAQTILSESVKLFQNQLQTLQLYTPSVEVETAVEREAAVWGRVKPIVTGPASEAGLRELVALADELLASAHQATIAYEARTNKTPGGLIKVLSRQRVLSQRIVSLYLAQRLGVQVNDRVELAGAEFHKALDEMYQSPQTNPSIKYQGRTRTRKSSMAFHVAGAFRPAGCRGRPAPAAFARCDYERTTAPGDGTGHQDV
jgi:hypothetical protein